ncbi:MAG: ATP-binding protein [Bacteroidota bacterium]
MKKVTKYRFLLLAAFSLLLFAVTLKSVFNPKIQPLVSSFQDSFSQKEQQLERFLTAQMDELKHNGDYAEWKLHQPDRALFLHVFRKDSLIYWNTTQLPVLQFADIHFPVNGPVHLQNGWDYARVCEKDGYRIVGSFLMRSEYPYQNEALNNEFADDLQIPIEMEITLERIAGCEIMDSKGNFLFSLLKQKVQPVSDTQSLLLLLFLSIAIFSALAAAFELTENHHPLLQASAILAVFILRLLTLRFDWMHFMKDTACFHPSLYASNEIFPNFFEYLINAGLIVFLVLAVIRLLRSLTHPRIAGITGLFMILSSFILWHFMLLLTEDLISNSSIPLLIDRLFELNAYSILTILSFAALYFSFYRYVLTGIQLYRRSDFGLNVLAVIIFLGSVLFFIFETGFGSQILLPAMFPLIFLSICAYRVFRRTNERGVFVSILFLFLFSSVTAVTLSEFSQRKEREIRALYASQLSSDKDPGTELEYHLLADKLKNDPFLLKFVSTPRNMPVSDFEDAMERRFFSGFWEKYELNFNIFDSLGNSLVVEEGQAFTFDGINQLIRDHGTVSELDPSVYFIHDNTDQYSYVIRQPLYEQDSSSKAALFCTLRSTKIPEEIGFPRLLISQEANVFNSLENYSIARYHLGKLITRYGTFNYPTERSAVRQWGNNKRFIDKDGFNHYLLESSANDLIILSGKNYTYVELITSFSYLFCFFGLLLLPALFTRGSRNGSFIRTISLAARIQLVLIAVVFVSLLGFGWGSGVFVRNQYNSYTNEVIREKMNSVLIELRSKLGTKKQLDIAVDGNYMEYLLRKFARVFVTDINIYSKDGMLLASSRPKIYNIGLISEQMHPDAYFAATCQKKSEFIHQENIGKLNYSSAYTPLYNVDGTLLGYVNLQHFGQQEDFEAQIQRFLVAIINVFMLLLAISTILSLLVSGWVTSPLRLLQESFAGVRFGKHNQKINYHRNDEIGALVKDYNQKLEELEFAAQQIAQNERESAWREMAKQVAHEIKNPLTPMKLSIQQLQRVYDPNNPKSAEKLNKVAASLIEQIDALTEIANEFSNFAKMPKPTEERLDLLPLLEGVIEVFQTEEETSVNLETTLDKAHILADKDQMIRVFNNLLKNAFQAIPEDRKGMVSIRVEQKQDTLRIALTDNGSGISESERGKIFVPYFTTKGTGTGLGLAMVKQIIENHRGSIDFRSTPGKGTTFIIYLPTVK